MSSPIKLRLDAAIPEQVTINRTFDLAISVRQPSSSILTEEGLSRVDSTNMVVSPPETEAYLQMRVKIEAEECEIHGINERTFRLYPGQDSPTLYFQLTPKQLGDISIIITVYQENDSMGSTRMHTIARENVVGKLQIDIASEPLSEGYSETAARVKPMKLQLTRRNGQNFEVRVLESSTGESGAVPSQLPYAQDELIVLLKALRTARYEPHHFSNTQTDILRRLGLLLESQFIPGILKQIGQTLYNSLMVETVGQAFLTTASQARPVRKAVALQLRFDSNAVELAQYPWELLYHHRELLLSGTVELTRYISYEEAVMPLNVSLPLKMVYLKARPTNLSQLDDNERIAVLETLKELKQNNLIEVNVLSEPTYQALLDYLEDYPVHILHFDGHGIFARLCPACGAMNYPHHPHCQAAHGCQQSLSGIEPSGYLAFEDEQTRQVKWIPSSILGNLLSRRSVNLAVLSACRSGSVGGEELFSGTAPALIQAGVPAVVSTQLPISVEGAAQFMRGFYRALARFESLPAAVNDARLHIPYREWFIPTLYLRSQDNEGRLFQKKN